MIYVDELRPVRVAWLGRFGCRMVSDDSIEELLSFANSIGLPLHWRRGHFLTPYFELASVWRARALRAGAMAATAQDLARIAAAAKGPGQRPIATGPRPR